MIHKERLARKARRLFEGIAAQANRAKSVSLQAIIALGKSSIGNGLLFPTTHPVGTTIIYNARGVPRGRGPGQAQMPVKIGPSTVPLRYFRQVRT